YSFYQFHFYFSFPLICRVSYDIISQYPFSPRHSQSRTSVLTATASLLCSCTGAQHIWLSAAGFLCKHKSVCCQQMAELVLSDAVSRRNKKVPGYLSIPGRKLSR